jgi:murein DD-endopeptidase MepM/ murein hydrolase activator NlpD
LKHKPFLLLFIITLFLLQMPVSAYEITSAFGWRTHPISGERSFHNGIDIAVEEGTQIAAIWAGEIVFAGWYEGYGNCVVISHGNNTYTLYGHCQQLLVSNGQTVSQGQVIALSGSTGYSTGPHLHLSLIHDNQYIDPMLIWAQ